MWTTYFSYIAQPNTDFDTKTDPHPDVPDDYLLSDLAFPVDWRENRKWDDGQFCNVTDPMTDYIIKTDSDNSTIDDR